MGVCPQCEEGKNPLKSRGPDWADKPVSESDKNSEPRVAEWREAPENASELVPASKSLGRVGEDEGILMGDGGRETSWGKEGKFVGETGREDAGMDRVI